MTTEISDRNAQYIYRISPTDKRVIDRKLNKARARWEAYRLLESEDEARAALLKLGGRE